MELFDSHAHLEDEKFEQDRIELIQQIKEAGITRLISAGYSLESSRKAKELAEKYDFIYTTSGISPNDIPQAEEELWIMLQEIKKIAKQNEKVVAIGEIGLDYHYGKENKDAQIHLFELQLAIAEKYHLPVIVHSREATLDTINSLKKFNVRGVIHSFSGSLETAEIYIKMGFLLGVNGVITFKNCNLKEVIEKIDLHNIILETDSPYLTPVPFRGKPNDPSKIINIAEYICELKQVGREELANITNLNIKRIFDI